VCPGGLIGGPRAEFLGVVGLTGVGFGRKSGGLQM
jgi:hypothetical protein